MYVCVCGVCNGMCTGRHVLGGQRLLDPPRTGVPGSCEPVGTGNLSNAGPPQEEYILLATQLLL